MKPESILVFLIVVHNWGEIKNEEQEVIHKRAEGETTEATVYEHILDNIPIEAKKFKNRTKNDCIINFLTEVIHQYGDTYMFIQDGESHNNLLHLLQTTFVHSYYNEPKLLQGDSGSDSFHHVIVFSDRFTVREVLEIRKPFLDTKYVTLVKNYNETIRIFQEFWEYRIIHTVASFVRNGTAYFYKYFPYGPDHCSTVGTPYLLATCDIITGIYTRKDVTRTTEDMRKSDFRLKIVDLRGCPINITLTQNVPAVYLSVTNEPTGWEVELLNEIMKHMNGVPNYNILKLYTNAYTPSEGYSSLLKHAEIGGGLVVSLKSLMKTDFCLYGHNLCTTWTVPMNHNAPHSASFLYKVFPVRIWILLLLSFLAMACAIKLKVNSSFGNIIFKLFPYLLGTTTRVKKYPRFLAAVWLWFCILTNAIYQSGYQSELLVPNLPQQITDQNQVFYSDLKIIGVPDVLVEVLPYYKRTRQISNRRLKHAYTNITQEKWVHKMTVKRKYAYLGFKEIIHYNTDKTDLSDELYIQQGCIIRYFLAFVLKKNSHLTKSVDNLSKRLSESGYLVYLIRKHLSQESRSNIPKNLVVALKKQTENNGMERSPSIDMNKMSVIFIPYMCCILLAVLVFILELMTKLKWNQIGDKFLREIESAWSYPE